MKTSLSVGMLTLLLFLGCSQEKQTTTQQTIPPLPVETITVKKEKIPIWKSYTGMTKASSDQDVKARVSGVLEAIYFKDGQYVTKGQKLFKIEQGEYLAALDAAKAKKRQDEASLALAKADVKRYMPLVQEGLAPRATLEQYQAQEAALEAAIAGDIAQIQKAELELSYTIIHAPINGNASARAVDVGNLVGQGEATLLTTIVNIDPIYAYFSPSQADADLFGKYKSKEKPDAFAEVPNANTKVRLKGFVDFENNSIDPLTSTLTMRATLDNKEHKVLPGTFVYVNLFISDKYEFLMIPPKVIFNDQLGSYVYIVDNNATLQRADIKTNYSNKYYVSITEGLKDGDKIAVSALMKLKPGREVSATDVTKTKGIKAILQENNLLVQEK
ncbi:MAG: efflux RND transporter periplasmic adaptor subunit [Campylobacterales bacterium]|nr:efflux RND transporter periplasmic adaptor subunit [Campylobacterales bacterium]